MTHISRLALAIAFTLPLACDKGATPETTGEPVAQATASAKAEPKERGDKPRGLRGARGRLSPVGMMLAAAATLTLDDAQKPKVDGLRASLKDDATRQAVRKLNESLAAAVKAGTVEASKLETELAALDAAAKSRRDAEVTALAELHKLLNAEQRKSVVASVRESHVARAERGGDGDKAPAAGPGMGRGGPGAWRGKAAGRGAGEGARAGSLEGLTKDLALTAEQETKVNALKEKARSDKAKPDLEALREEHKKQGEALLVAFEKDDFDATKVELSSAPLPGAMSRPGAEKMIEQVRELTAILTPEQREKLAKRLTEPPRRMTRGLLGPRRAAPRADPAAADDDGNDDE